MPRGVVPAKDRVHHLRWAMNSLRLRMGHRVGPLLRAIEAIKIPRARRHVLDQSGVVTFRPAPQRNEPLWRTYQMDFNPGGTRSP